MTKYYFCRHLDISLKCVMCIFSACVCGTYLPAMWVCQYEPGPESSRSYQGCQWILSSSYCHSHCLRNKRIYPHSPWIKARISNGLYLYSGFTIKAVWIILYGYDLINGLEFPISSHHALYPRVNLDYVSWLDLQGTG